MYIMTLKMKFIQGPRLEFFEKKSSRFIIVIIYIYIIYLIGLNLCPTLWLILCRALWLILCLTNIKVGAQRLNTWIGNNGIWFAPDYYIIFIRIKF